MSKFLILKALPALLSTAYAMKFPNKRHNIFRRFYEKIKLLFRMIFDPVGDLQQNIQILQYEFNTIRDNAACSPGQKVCLYVVEKSDHNGAILGNNLIYYHLYKIQYFQAQGYLVMPILVNSLETLNEKIGGLPQNKIDLIDVVAHGSANSVGQIFMTHNSCKIDKLAPDAQIILDACSTVVPNSEDIAHSIAQDNNGVEVFACKDPLFFSQPIIRNNIVESVPHGFCIIEPYWMKKIKCDRTQNESSERLNTL